MAPAAPTFTPETTAGLVLAAGAASRFGSDKRRARLDDGTPLLVRSTQLLTPCCRDVFVALRPDDRPAAPELLDSLWSRVEPIYARRAAEGMGGTLAEAMTAIKSHQRANQRQYAGVLIMLADLPRVRPATVAALVAAAAEDKVALPTYQGQWGNPVLFGRRWFDALCELSGDRGGRKLFAHNADRRVLVPVDDPGILRDIDTPGDLA